MKAIIALKGFFRCESLISSHYIISFYLILIHRLDVSTLLAGSVENTLVKNAPVNLLP